MSKEGGKAVYEEAYNKLKVGFITRLKGSVESIDNIISQRQLQPLSKDDLHRAQRLVHHLSGSGTTFGFPKVTDKARAADLYLDRMIKLVPDGQSLNDNDFKDLEALLTDLRQICQEAVQSAETQKPAKKVEPYKAKKTEKPGSKKHHVMIVDDDEALLNLFSMKLQMKGMRVSAARDGNAALGIVNKEIPDLIVLDIMMPGISGHEVLRRLKQDPGLVSVPVIMLTAQTQQQDVVNALHSGAIDYLIKPVDPDKLVARVERTLEAGSYTIMVVDNDRLILELLASKCREKGCHVIVEEDGKKAWDQILLKLPDLVVLDRMLPGMDGLEVLKNMRAEKSTKNIPVIILSARGEARDIEVGMQMGAQEYVVKPFLPDDLLTTGLKLIKKASEGGLSVEG